MKKKPFLITAAALIFVLAVGLCSCGEKDADKEGAEDLEDLEEITDIGMQPTKGMTEFVIGENVTVGIPEGYVPEDSYAPDMSEEAVASIFFTKDSNIDDTIEARYSMPESGDAEDYELRVEEPDSFKDSDDIEYGSIDTPVGEMLYKYVKSDTMNFDIEDGNEDEEKQAPELSGTVKIGKNYLTVDMINMTYDEANYTTTYNKITKDDFKLFENYVKTQLKMAK